MARGGYANRNTDAGAWTAIKALQAAQQSGGGGIDQTARDAAASAARQDSPALERNVLRLLQRVTHLPSATWFSFPPRLRPYEPGRRRLIVRNLHATSACKVGYGTRANVNYSSPSTTEFNNNGTINPGQQIELGADDRMLFCRPAVSGDGLDVEVYCEIGVTV